ncbi:uncharacterized protein LOC123525799 [Mercenaria mercenaria]|uniref:uncharacterized protein LOC123525799 n=1 Tax=Mercenaria mercenaria TaxID=6596 RepID=UPI00234F43D0|nr:uncharacterized protein LOC123525799 [Mercenaria mercenaria]
MPQVPLTGCLVTANFDLTSVARYSSRLCILKMNPKVGPKQPRVASELEALAVSASAALPILLQTVYTMTPGEIHATTRTLMDTVPCDLRVVEGLSVPLTAAKKLLERAGRSELLPDVQVYLEQVLFPYISDTMPGSDSVPNIIIEKMLNYEDQIFQNTDLKGDEIRVIRSFLVEVCGVNDSLLARLRKERFGQPSKVVRMKGSLVRATVLDFSSLREDLKNTITTLMSREGVEEVVEEAGTNIAGDENIVTEAATAAVTPELQIQRRVYRRHMPTSRSNLRQTRSRSRRN